MRQQTAWQGRDLSSSWQLDFEAAWRPGSGRHLEAEAAWDFSSGHEMDFEAA